MDFQAINRALIGFVQETFSGGKIVKLQKTGNEWSAKVEVIEESDYAKKLGKTDIVGVYEITLNEVGQVTGFTRLFMRERTDISKEGPNADD